MWSLLFRASPRAEGVGAADPASRHRDAFVCTAGKAQNAFGWMDLPISLRRTPASRAGSSAFSDSERRLLVSGC